MLNSPKQSFKPDIQRACDLRKDQPDVSGADGVFSFGWGYAGDVNVNLSDAYRDFNGDFVDPSANDGLVRYTVPSVIKEFTVFVMGDGGGGRCTTIVDQFPDFCLNGIFCGKDTECCQNLGICCTGVGAGIGCTGPVTKTVCDELGGNHYDGITSCEDDPDFCEKGQGCCIPDPAQPDCVDCNVCTTCDDPACTGGCFTGQCQCVTSGCGCRPCCQYGPGGIPVGCEIQVDCPAEAVVDDCDECGNTCEDGTAYGFCCQGTSTGDVTCSGGKMCENSCGDGGKIVGSCDECINDCSDPDGPDCMKFACFPVPGASDQCFGTWNGGADECPDECNDDGGGGGDDLCGQCNPSTGLCDLCLAPPGPNGECGCDGCPGAENYGDPCTEGLFSPNESFAAANHYRAMDINNLNLPQINLGDYLRGTGELTFSTSLLFGSNANECNVCIDTNRRDFIAEQSVRCPPSDPGGLEIKYDLSELCVNDTVELELQANENFITLRVFVTYYGEEERNLLFNDKVPRTFVRKSVLGEYDCETCEFNLFCRPISEETGETLLERYEFSPALSKIETGGIGTPIVGDRYNSTRTISKISSTKSPFFTANTKFTNSEGESLTSTNRSITAKVNAISRYLRSDVYHVGADNKQTQVNDAKIGAASESVISHWRQNEATTASFNVFGGISGDFIGSSPQAFAGGYGYTGDCETDLNPTEGHGFLAVSGIAKIT